MEPVDNDGFFTAMEERQPKAKQLTTLIQAAEDYIKAADGCVFGGDHYRDGFLKAREALQAAIKEAQS